MKFRLTILFLMAMILLSTCRKDDHIIFDCFDDEDYAYSFLVNIKTFNKDLSVYTFLVARDSLGRPVYYKIRVTSGDSFVYEPEFRWCGNGTDQDSMVV